LRLVGAFWTATFELPGDGSLPTCATAISLKALEKPIIGLEDDVVLVGDDSAKIRGFDRQTKKLLFSASWTDEKDEHLSLRTPVAMATTRCGRLLGRRAARADCFFTV